MSRRSAAPVRSRAKMAVKIDGLREFQAALRKADKQLPRQLRKGFNEVAELVADEAQRRTPVGPTGNLRASIRPQSQQRAGQVIMGYNSKVPYAGWIEFGGQGPNGNPRPREFRREGRYLFPVAEDMSARILKETSRVLDRIAAQAGLV